MADTRPLRLSDAKLRGLRAAAADRLGQFPLGTPVATTNSLRDAGLALGRDACGHRLGPGHRHDPVLSFITPAGRDAIGADQPPALTAAGTDLERRCAAELADTGYADGFTVVEVEAGGVRIELDDPTEELLDSRVLVMTSGLYADGWRPLKEDDRAGLYPVPLVPAGEPHSAAGMCRQCGRALRFDESGRCVQDEYGEYLCLTVKNPESKTHVIWE